MRLLLLLAAALLAAAAYADKRQSEYLFPYDLGPASVDVSAYPDVQRKNYELFAGHCSACHTLARAINHPAVTRSEWTPYADRMHASAGYKKWTEIPAGDLRAIVDFLVYDSNERKVKRAAEFSAKRRELDRLFLDVRRTRGAR